MIITTSKNGLNLGAAYLNNYPDPFVSEKTKLTDEDYIKNVGDYFANLAFAQYNENKRTIIPNYEIMKGILKARDFYRDDEPIVKDFLDTLKAGEQELASYVKHYSIMNPPIAALMGELSKRPDIHRIRAFDDQSQNEELQYKTELLQKLILQDAKRIIMNKLAIQGVDMSQIDDEQMQKLTVDSVKDELDNYTSIAERWGSHMLNNLKVEFNIKEKSEDVFGDLCKVAREFYEVYEDTSKTGFNVRALNPKNVWWKSSSDVKFTSGASGDSNVPYCIGTIYVKELSQIISDEPDITKEEVDHLRTAMQNSLFMPGRTSTLFTNEQGIDSIHYETYNRLIYQERMFQQAEMGAEFRDDMSHFLGGSNAFSFGYKFVVMKGYFNSKKKIGKLTYMDEDGQPQATLVDESYKKAPNEIDVEWGYVNQWYQITKIGPDVYHIKPFVLLDYAPIIGLVHDAKNGVPQSLVDMMKPLQVLFNVCMNQLYELLEKEIGNVARINIRRIPRAKDGTQEDAIDIMEDDMRNRGMLLDDDSPENTKGATGNQTVASQVDLTRSTELQTRYGLAVQLQEMAWQLVGMNRQRLGSTLASETATANQNSLVQSYAQTETYFTVHNYVLSQLYQAMLDAAQFIECKKPNSSVSYVNAAGVNQLITVMGEDIRLRDLKAYVTSRAEDQQLFTEFRQLSQAMIQNGASIYDVSVLFATNSIREMQKIFKDLKEKNEGMMQQQQQNEQMKLQQEQEINQATLEQNERHHQEDLQMEKYGIDVKANTDLAKAEITTFFQAPTTDADGNGTPDIMDIANHQIKLQEIIEGRDLENKRLRLEQQKFMADQKQKQVENKVDQQKLKNDGEKLKIQRKAANKKPAAKK